MVGPDQYSIERLEERPWLKIMLLCYRKYRVLEIIFVGARIYDACQLKNSLSLIEFCDVGWHIPDPNRSGPDTPLVHQEQQSLGWSVPKPELWSEHVAD